MHIYTHRHFTIHNAEEESERQRGWGVIWRERGTERGRERKQEQEERDREEREEREKREREERERREREKGEREGRERREREERVCVCEREREQIERLKRCHVGFSRHGARPPGNKTEFG